MKSVLITYDKNELSNFNSKLFSSIKCKFYNVSEIDVFGLKDFDLIGFDFGKFNFVTYKMFISLVKNFSYGFDKKMFFVYRYGILEKLFLVYMTSLVKNKDLIEIGRFEMNNSVDRVDGFCRLIEIRK